MPTSSTTVWSPGFSDNPAGKTLRAKSIIPMLDRIGDEKVGAPGSSAFDGLWGHESQELLATQGTSDCCPAKFQADQPHALRNSTQLRMSAADLSAMTFSTRRICSPTE
jgi:hypothetical protein